MKSLNIAILASTRGTDMQAIIDAIDSGELNAIISVVVSNKDCPALERARNHEIKAAFIEAKGKEREQFDREVAKVLEEEGAELILLIGYMRYLSKWFVDKYKNKIMNIHPSLLPAFAGGMDMNVHQKVLDAGVKKTGCTLHFVDEGADTGPIILQEEVEIEEDDTADTLKLKVQAAEQRVLLEGIKLFSQGKLNVKGDKVVIDE